MNHSLLILIAILLIPYTKTLSQIENKSLMESFKEKQLTSNDKLYDYDSISKIYINYVYNIAFDAPDNWKIDFGVTKHSLLRGYDPDFGSTFSIVVVEPSIEKSSTSDYWKFYTKQKDEFDNSFINNLRNQANVEPINYKSSMSYIKNFKSLKQVFEHRVISGDLDYINYVIIQQVYRGKYLYTFTLQLPKFIYEQNSDFFNKTFNNINFTPDSETINY